MTSKLYTSLVTTFHWSKYSHMTRLAAKDPGKSSLAGQPCTVTTHFLWEKGACSWVNN
jgi:hypothetical protein